jgi:DNA-binding NtrC family response regulator
MQANGTTILIVDDDKTVRSMLAWMLGDEYRCFTAGSAEEAMEILLDGRFKLVITDLNMPGASGFELCQGIKQTSPDTIVLMMSGQKDPQNVIEAVRCGASGYLIKPTDLLHIDRTVKSFLASQDC